MSSPEESAVDHQNISKFDGKFSLLYHICSNKIEPLRHQRDTTKENVWITQNSMWLHILTGLQVECDWDLDCVR